MKLFPFILGTFAPLVTSPSLQAQLIQLQVVATGLTRPVDVDFSPVDSRLFVAEQNGQIRIVEGGVLLPTPFFDGSSFVAGDAYTGLRGICLHPDYANNGQVFFSYDTAFVGPGDLVIDRITVSSADPNVADPTSRVEILRVAQYQPLHGGGDLAFGPDGYLYTAIGDGHGPSDDPYCSAQDGSTLLGKMVRLDVDGGVPYAIPADNPFVGDPLVRDEIWHLGLRHPWRWSFDSATGDLYIGDVGQHEQEEIDFAAAGVSALNYGWKVMEGSACDTSAVCTTSAACNDSSYTDPIVTQPTSSNRSIIGGFVYRGNALPEDYGRYFFGSFSTGTVWSMEYDGSTVSNLTQRFPSAGGFSNLASFAQDSSGEIYVVLLDGRVAKFIPYCGVSGLCSTPFCFGRDDGCAACPCGNDADAAAMGGCSNASGASAVLVASGASSVANPTLRFEVESANPQTFGILLSADNRLPQSGPCPPGSGILSSALDGLRCVGGAALRHGSRPTDASGSIGATTNGWGAPDGPPGGLVANGGFVSGQTRQFQCFYREDVALGCMTGQNTTNAVTITFQ